jgi:hypothetical protein
MSSKASKMFKMPHITRNASHHFKKDLNFSGNAFKKNRNVNKSLNPSENIFKIPQKSRAAIAALLQ